MKPKTMMLVGSLAVLFSMFIPWVTASTALFALQRSAKGYETDGVFAAILGLVTLIMSLVVKESPGKTYQGLGGFMGILIMAVGVIVALNIFGAGSDSVDVSIDYGVFACLVGGLLVTVGGFTTVPGQPESTITVTELPEDEEEK